MERFRGNLYAKNVVAVCVDGKREDGTFYGRLEHCYAVRGTPFRSARELLLQMDALYDRIRFPQAAVTTRRFGRRVRAAPRPVPPPMKRQPSEVHQCAGRLATVLVLVQFRQNATWQGLAVWREQDRVCTFRSFLELLRLLRMPLE